ncbi:MG2 domain-containing protein [Planctopirus hydrillae]|uniref:Alpha-2-macroglobulin n=1 Tax=Planctopirus hydrillae TaxID=1841610 RepID=A0A1C3E632_9PLAN|nr:MG2 domain-containing protein [Planctopirus hydrillae]ODA28706.1 hypothetical protein A6X21_12175 [Planctopirus hydrillae]
MKHHAIVKVLWSGQRWAALCVLVACITFIADLTLGWRFVMAEKQPGPATVSQTKELIKQGNFLKALELIEPQLSNPESDPAQISLWLPQMLDCLQRLGRIERADELLEKAIANHAKSYQVLAAAGESYQRLPSNGQMIANEFIRGNGDGRGKTVWTDDRDRVRALQLLNQAWQLAPENPPKVRVDILQQMVNALTANRSDQQAWQLQTLTNLDLLPEFEEVPIWFRGGESSDAPVTPHGQPLYYSIPESWAAAKSDGERYRWLLAEQKKILPSEGPRVDLEFAQFAQSQFGVQTLSSRGWFRLPDPTEEGQTGAILSLETLAPNETVARLANGIRRFQLRDDYAFLTTYETLADGKNTGIARTARELLAITYENRRQYPQAAAEWRELLKQDPKSPNAKSHLEQIVNNWLALEPARSQISGTSAKLSVRYRNGKNISFVAEPIRVAELFREAQSVLKTNPRNVDWSALNPDQIGYSIVTGDQKKFVGPSVARWSQVVVPRPEHRDSLVEVDVPKLPAGAYLITVTMEGGNQDQIILWLNDLALVRKAQDAGPLYFVANASTGAPVADASLELFGWKQQWDEKGRRANVQTKTITGKSNAQGIASFPRDEMQDYQWFVSTRTPAGQSAQLGLQGYWYGQRSMEQEERKRSYVVTDRPVYRPSQTVHLKIWQQLATYAEVRAAVTPEGQPLTIRLRKPQGEVVLEKQLAMDRFGGVEFDYELPSDAALGEYAVEVENSDWGRFRVEEYKKPEFEVLVDGPETPTRLGQKFKAKITAKYYFGSPVSQGTVSYKIERQASEDRFFPITPWDWLYGRGAWWFATDATWYPGFERWGCLGPVRGWWPRQVEAPELVASGEAPLSADGTYEIEIDTAIAKELFGKTDHKYTIQAEVTDGSRRMVSGNGSVLVTRQPLQVTVWVDRGYFQAGDTVQATAMITQPGGVPFAGEGQFTLYSVRYAEDGTPQETKVDQWASKRGEDGLAKQSFVAAKAGQYRLAYLAQIPSATDKAQMETVEGAYLFTVRGEDVAPGGFRFSDLELTTDRREYAPGETVQLMVSTNQPNSTVLVFLRSSNGVGGKVEVKQLVGQTMLIPIPLDAADRPNIFVEAITVSAGVVHSAVREIFVPPAGKLLDVSITPSQVEYLPGSEAQATLEIKDKLGQPFVGQLALSVYDRSIDAIAGGPLSGDIREFFWSWKRTHTPQNENNLSRTSFPARKPYQVVLQPIGIFGNMDVDDKVLRKGFGGGLGARRGAADGNERLFSAMAGGGGGAPGAPMAAAMAAPMAKSQVAESIADSVALDINEANAAPVTIRQEFADTAFWNGSIITDESGRAVVKFKMPENITGWKLRTWAMGPQAQVGEATSQVVTRKNLIVRLQAPRFFVEKDEVVLSANVRNEFAEALAAQVSIEFEGDTLKLLTPAVADVVIDGQAEVRVDWRVKVVREGTATIRMMARSTRESDATQMKFPVYVHGAPRQEPFAGTLKPGVDSLAVEFKLPAERRPETAVLDVRYSPTLAGAIVDALPYLVEFPYGCTEQTLNRFLPTLATQRLLLSMNLSLEEIAAKRSQLNPQEAAGPDERAVRWKRFDREPVFNKAEVAKMSREGLETLVEMQLSDGGWGWFSGFGERSWPHTTAVVVHGLLLAKDNEAPVNEESLARGIAWLQSYQAGELRRLKLPQEAREHKAKADDTDALVYSILSETGQFSAEMREFLYRDRVDLSVYSMSLFALALHAEGRAEQLAMLQENIGQFVVQDASNETAFLRLPAGSRWWLWHGSDIEAMATYLKLLVRTNPQSEVAPRLVKYLLNNRRHATYWNSTRDTALVVEAFVEYLKATGELNPQMTVEVWLDGKLRQEVALSKENLFTAQTRLLVTGDELTTGAHRVEFRRKGEGPVYFNVDVSYFSLEDPIPAVGLEVKVDRKFYRLDPIVKDGVRPTQTGAAQSVDEAGFKKTPLASLDELKSGDLLEVELIIETKNDYEYLLFEDLKAAGSEAVDLRSGYTGNELGAFVEFRDERVAFFVRLLPRGRHQVSYRLRAEIPGQFSALPARGHAMYAPELRGNSDEFKLRIVD